jgi:stringent starvation protein B
MTTVKPYLVRAVYEWIVDNECTPYIAVDTTFSQVSVPEKYIVDNSIVLDISPTSIQHLLIDNEALTCKARFDGTIHNLYIPIIAISAIHTAENDQGMTFPKEEPQEIPTVPEKNKLQLRTAKKNAVTRF